MYTKAEEITYFFTALYITDEVFKKCLSVPLFDFRMILTRAVQRELFFVSLPCFLPPSSEEMMAEKETRTRVIEKKLIYQVRCLYSLECQFNATSIYSVTDMFPSSITDLPIHDSDCALNYPLLKYNCTSQTLA